MELEALESLDLLEQRSETPETLEALEAQVAQVPQESDSPVLQDRLEQLTELRDRQVPREPLALQGLLVDSE